MIVAEAGGPFPVITGGDGGVVTTMVKVCVAFGTSPLLAVTVTVKLPVWLGVPDSRPLTDKAIPVGKFPEVTVNMGGGKPEAV